MRANEFLKLVKEGKTYREIGEIYNLSRTVVYLDLHKYWDKETIKEAIEIGKSKVDKITYYKTICKYCGETTYKKTRGVKFCNRDCYTKALKDLYKKL